MKQILKSDKKVKQIGNEILEQLDYVDDFIIGKVTDTRYQNDDFSYDQIKMNRFDSNNSKWYDTKKELPKKNQIVAVKLNANWFNDYLILEETEIKDYSTKSNSINHSQSSYKTTKELSLITGLSSREINSAFVGLKLMEKNENDWYATKKGEKLGAIQKEGQYGKFIIWPENIIAKLK